MEQYSRRNSLRIEGIPDINDGDSVGSVMDVLDAMSLKPNVTNYSIDRVRRLGVWRHSNSTPRAVSVKRATYGVRLLRSQL